MFLTMKCMKQTSESQCTHMIKQAALQFSREHGSIFMVEIDLGDIGALAQYAVISCFFSGI